FAASHRALLTGTGIAVGALLVAAAVVAVRLHEARIDLASSFRERAYRAERDGDWSKAAAYFAAARVQHDTNEERWGLAVAGERITERILSLQGPAESFIDVGALPDGRVVALGLASDRVEIRDVDSGQTLGTRPREMGLTGDIVMGGRIRLAYGDRWDYFDAATGQKLRSWPRASGEPCAGPFPPAAVVLGGQLVHREDGGEPRVLAADMGGPELCAVSDDGRQVVYADRSLALRLLAIDDGHELAQRKPDVLHNFRFSRHGVVVFKQGRVVVFGGPEGDFAIDLPEAKFGAQIQTPITSGFAVSADGELVAIASREG